MGIALHIFSAICFSLLFIGFLRLLSVLIFVRLHIGSLLYLTLFVESLHFIIYSFSYSLHSCCFHVYTLQTTLIWTFLLVSPHALSRVFLNCAIGFTLSECMNADFQFYSVLTNLSPKLLHQFSLSPALWDRFCCSMSLPTLNIVTVLKFLILLSISLLFLRF